MGSQVKLRIRSRARRCWSVYATSTPKAVSLSARVWTNLAPGGLTWH